MSIFKKIIGLLAVIIVFVGILFVIATAYGWERVWQAQFGSPDMGPVAFDGLRKTSKPNQALVCPDGLCIDAERDLTSPVYAQSAATLRDNVLKIVTSWEDTARVDDDADPFNLRFVSRSPMLRFPDTTRVRLIPLGANRSTLAIYAQAQIGEADFGKNLERVKTLLETLKPLEATP